jgi:hypothetical protein
LLNQAGISPLLVCTDQTPALATREHTSTPLVLVLPPEGETTEERADRYYRVDGAHRGGPRLAIFQLGRNRLALPEQATEDRRLIAERLGELAESFDLAEPFQRIREAIEEAQQAVR